MRLEPNRPVEGGRGPTENVATTDDGSGSNPLGLSTRMQQQTIAWLRRAQAKQPATVAGILAKHAVLRVHSPAKFTKNKVQKPWHVRALQFLFSGVGLTILVVLYLLLGALLLQAIELPPEMKAAEEVRIMAAYIENNRSMMVERIERIKQMVIEEHNDVVGIPRLWAIAQFNKLLNEYQQRLIEAIAQGYDGTVHSSESYGWSVSSAILFTSSTLTTIGYGHVAPKTELGKLLVVIYSVIALPVLSIFLVKIGGIIGGLIRYLYNGVLCRRLAWQRERRLVRQLIQYDEDWSPDSLIIKWKKQMFVRLVLSFDYGRATPPTLAIALFVLFYLCCGTVLFAALEPRWSIVNSLYCCFTTMLTIGFGDLVPGRSAGNTLAGNVTLFFSSVYMVVGLAVLAMGVDIIRVKMKDKIEQADLSQLNLSSDSDSDYDEDA